MDPLIVIIKLLTKTQHFLKILISGDGLQFRPLNRAYLKFRDHSLLEDYHELQLKSALRIYASPRLDEI